MRARQAALATLLVLLAAIGLFHLVGMREARAALLRADPDAVAGDPQLRAIAIRQGRGIFLARCAACHGRDGRGDPGRGVPDLTDRDFLYGQGRASEIELIVLHGIRAHDSKGWNLASMPAYATARPYASEPIAPLTPADIADTVAFLQGLTGKPADPATAARGRAIYAGRGGCWDCHGPDAHGDPAIGAPDLTDAVQLYGRGPKWLAATLAHGRHGTCPAFARSLDPGAARAVAIYAALLHPSVAGAS